MLRFMDSFSHYSNNDILGIGNCNKWSALLGSNNNSLQYVTLNPGGGRFGSTSFRVGGNAFVYLSKTLDSQPTWIIGFAFRITTLAPNNPMHICGLFDGGVNQVTIVVNADLTLSVTRIGTALTNSLTSTTKSALSLSLNTWNYIEFLCTINPSISANTCKVNVNGTTWINLTSAQSTRNTSNSSANQIAIGAVISSNSAANNLDYCDLYVCDGTGSTNNTFLGDCRVEPRWPLAAGTNTAWLANGGTTVGCVQEIGDNADTNYISSLTTNDISTFTVPPLSITPSSIFGVQLTHCSRKSDAGLRQIADVIRSGSTNFVGTTINLSPSYQFFPIIYENDPNTSAPWTTTNVNALEIGAKEIT